MFIVYGDPQGVNARVMKLKKNIEQHTNKSKAAIIEKKQAETALGPQPRLVSRLVIIQVKPPELRNT